MPISTIYRMLAGRMATETRRKLALGTVVSVLLAVAGWVITTSARVSAVEARTDANTQRLERLERQSDVIQGYLQEILVRTGRIEGKLERR